MKKGDTPETLDMAVREIIRHIKAIKEIEKTIDEAWGVRLTTGYIPSITYDAVGEVHVRRGIEALETAFGQEAKHEYGMMMQKVLRHNGVRFIQYADEKTKVFVKAGKEPPKVMIVEE